jgi:phage tail-like protein
MNSTALPKRGDRYWFLDNVAGWREGHRDGLELTVPEGDLILDRLPGSASLLLDEAQQAAEFRCPTALCTDGRGNLLVVDAALNLVKCIDLPRNSVSTLPATGGKGVAPRQLNEPRGIAVLSNGSIVVSDTGNHHIKIFAAATYALLQDWGENDAFNHPRQGNGPQMFRFPWAVAVDNCNIIYIVDRGNRRIQKIHADGAWQGELSDKQWVSPTRLALGPDGVLALVDAGANAVFIIKSGVSQTLSGVNRPRGVAIDTEARVYVGDDEGLIHLFIPDPNNLDVYQLAGWGVMGFDGGIVDLTWDNAYGLLAIVAETANGCRQRLWKIDPNGASARTGTFITRALDSTIPNCQWHRVLLNASLPKGTSIQIDSFSAEEDPHNANSDSPPQAVDPLDASFNQWKLCIKAGDDNPDCLVQSGPGRYLWFRLTFSSNGLTTPQADRQGWDPPSVLSRGSPTLRSLKVFYPRVSYLQYLPAVYQENEDSRLFLDRFLSIFQSEFDDLDLKIDRIWQLFNPGSVPAKALGWLASWLALEVDPGWSENKLRKMLKKAFRAQCQRGTVKGLVQAIHDYAGAHAVVIEHFKLRRLPILSAGYSLNNGVRLWSKNFYKRLQVGTNSRIGDFQLVSEPAPDVEPLNQDANQFTVLFLANPYGPSDAEQKIGQVVEREKPVHTQAAICPLLPRFRVGVQSTVGIDSVVGGITRLVLNRLSTLGYDSILGCSPAEQKLRELGLAPRPVVGRSSLLS